MENLAFHSLLRWNIIILPIVTTSLGVKGFDTTTTLNDVTGRQGKVNCNDAKLHSEIHFLVWARGETKAVFCTEIRDKLMRAILTRDTWIRDIIDIPMTRDTLVYSMFAWHTNAWHHNTWQIGAWHIDTWHPGAWHTSTWHPDAWPSPPTLSCYNLPTFPPSKKRFLNSQQLPFVKSRSSKAISPL